MKKIIVLADQNQRAAVAIFRSLKASGVECLPIFSVDTKVSRTFIGRSGFCSFKGRIYRYDDSSEHAFIGSLCEISKEVGECVLFPVGERLLRWAIGRKDDLSRGGVIVPTVDLDRYLAVSNKSSFIDLAEVAGLARPRELEALPALFKHKFVVKGKRGNEGESSVLSAPILVESEESFRGLIDLNLDLSKHLIQEFIDGPSYYYCALYDQGEKLSFFSQKTLAQEPDGKSVIKAHPVSLPDELVRCLDGMMRSLRWYGVAMIEIKRANGRWYAIECNPRFWGPLQLAVDNGVDFPLHLWLLVDSKSTSIHCDRESAGYGYIWISGYLSGLIRRIKSKNAFQWYEEDGVGFKYRDVWARRGTLKYFFVESAFLFLKLLRVLILRK